MKAGREDLLNVVAHQVRVPRKVQQEARRGLKAVTCRNSSCRHLSQLEGSRGAAGLSQRKYNAQVIIRQAE